MGDTMAVQLQLDLPPAEDYRQKIRESIASLLARSRPSARELVEHVETHLGMKARWDIESAVRQLSVDKGLTQDARAFLLAMLESDLSAALRGKAERDQDAHTGIDELLRQGQAYRDSAAFSEMIQFCAKFREYAPFNNLLVRTQNPSCAFFATQAHWRNAFHRSIKEDARPMVILAPMQPVLLVYDIDQTEGPPLPAQLEEFGRFDGKWKPDWLARMVENAARHYAIRVDFKTLSSTHAGFATIDRQQRSHKMRIALHNGLDEPSRFGVLCHELAHVFLGHLGNDDDRWWPNRWNIDRHSMEIEAEATAFIATWRIGLRGSSPAYVSQHLPEGQVPPGVSADHIAKIAGRIEQMARERLPERRPGERARRRTASRPQGGRA